MCSALAISCFLISLEAVNREKRKIRIARELESIIFQMEALLKYGSYNVYQICEKCFSDAKAFDASSFKEISGDFSGSFITACKVSLEEADDKTLSAFTKIADFLGMYESETQLSGLDAVLEEVKINRVSMENMLVSKRKLYLCLGAFSGIVICLILT